jgi:hypothetical protein
VPAGATLIATDHFLRDAAAPTTADPSAGQYVASGTVNQLRRADASGGGQNPTVSGYNGAWSGNVTSGSLAVAHWTAELDPIVTPQTGAYQAGGRARFGGNAAANTVQRRVERPLAAYAASNTYYMSLTSQVATGDTVDGSLARGFVGIGFTNAPTGTNAQRDAAYASTGMRGLLIGAYEDGPNTDYVVRHVGSSGALQNDVIADNIVQGDITNPVFARYTVVRVDFNDDPTNPAGNSKLTIWHEPTAASLTSEAAASAAAAPIVLRTFALATSADLTQMTFLGLNWSKAASFDEPRLGTTWADVVAVPEPATAALFGVVGAAFIRRRRR